MALTGRSTSGIPLAFSPMKSSQHQVSTFFFPFPFPSINIKSPSPSLFSQQQPHYTQRRPRGEPHPRALQYADPSPAGSNQAVTSGGAEKQTETAAVDQTFLRPIN
jgi:hypothetical protein